MAKPFCLAAVVSMTLVAIGFAVLGSAPEASIPGRPATFTGATAERDLQELRAKLQPRSVAIALPLPTLALQPGFGPVQRPAGAPGRPQARSFWAQGPQVARILKASFEPPVRPYDLLVPDPPPRLTDASHLLCLAVAIYHEARNQSLDGQLAVASVILNRARVPDRWGRTPCDVVVPGQFSFMSADGSYPPIDDRTAWEIALEMGREALERGPSPLVGRADHYHTPEVDPAWNEDLEQVIRIDNHIFFIDPARQG